jgi:hydroxymethylbilane synthase
MKDKIVIGTRKSLLALTQSEFIATCLRKQYPGLEVTLQHIVTTGDKVLDVPLAKIGGKGLFTKELEKALLNGTIDLAVHSLKDVPTVLPPGLTLAAITKRENRHDALISPKYKTLDALPKGAKVGTSSLRRTAQLFHLRPDLTIVNLRGNIDTRLKMLDAGKFDAIILAAAGLNRLGLNNHITQILPNNICLPAVGQGALAIEASANNKEVLDMLNFLNDKDSLADAIAERSFLDTVQGGCQVPVGVYADSKNGQLTLEAVIISLDGKTMYRRNLAGAAEDAQALGVKLANTLLDMGGREILHSLGIM